MKRALATLCLLFSVVSVSAQAQPAPATPQWILVHEEIAKPSMLPQYEATSREFVSALNSQKADPNVLGMNVYQTNDMHFLYVAQISSFAGVDTFFKGFGALAQSYGPEKFNDLMRRSYATMESYNEYVAMRRPDLSYVPANPRFPMSERRFLHWQFYYIDPAHTAEAEQAGKDIAALFKSKNISDGYTTWQVMSGNDLPLYVVVTSGRNAADYYTNDVQIQSALGNDMRPLQGRVFGYTRKYEQRDGTYRPDLSYPAPAAVTPK